jgi:hypothetical protein
MLKSKGRLGFATLACVGLAIAISTPVAAWERGEVTNFSVPSGQPMVEGLAVDKQGNVYTPTFNPTGSPPARLFTFDPNGNVINNVPIQIQNDITSSAMLGVAFRPGTDGLLVIDFGKGQVLSV